MSKEQYSCVIPERDHLKACHDLLAGLSIVSYRMNTGRAKYANKDGTDRFVRYGHKGMSDIIGYIPMELMGSDKAVPLFWEVKKKGGKPTQFQESFVLKAKSSGCFAGWGTVEDLVDELKKWGIL